MKKLLFFFVSLTIFMNFKLSAQTFQWAKSYGGTAFDLPNGIVKHTNSSDNGVYVTGEFDSPSITFGSITLNKSGSLTNMFLVKYDVNGNVIWAKNVGGTSYVRGEAIAQSWYGGVYVAGEFGGSSGGSVTFGSTTLTSAGGIDIFIAQYDGNGNVLYATRFGGTGSEDNIKMSGDGSNFSITGTSFSPSLTLGSTTLTLTGNGDGFIAKFDSINCNNNFCWAKSIIGASAADVKENPFTGGGVIITGGLSGTANFSSTTLTSVGGSDIFIATYDWNGNLLLAKREGGASDEAGIAIVVPPNSTDMYVAGTFGSSTYSVSPAPTTIIGSTTLTVIGPDSSGWYYPDIFLTKFDASGNALWAKGIHATKDERAVAISADFYKNVFIGGGFRGPYLLIGSDSLVNNDPTFAAYPAGHFTFFVGKYDPNGNFLWAKKNGGNNSSICGVNSCHISPVWSNTAYIAGDFQSSSISFDNTTLTGPGGGDGFLTKLYDCNTVAPSICVVTVDSLSENNIIVWDKPVNTPIDSIIIYRNTTDSTYLRIGAVANDSATLSQFVDTARSIGGPNGGNPNITSFQYKIATLDSCGTLSAMSPFHKTLFMLQTGANFDWNDYKIEGQSIPVPGLSNYLFQRDSFSTGNFQTFASLPNSSTATTDPNYSTLQNTASWRVITQWTTQCTATKSSVDYNSSRSNVKGIAAPGGTSDFRLPTSDFLIYPNPNDGSFNIELRSSVFHFPSFISIYNILGEEVYHTTLNSKQKTLNLKLSKGIYQLKFESDAGIVNKKIIIE